MLPEGLVFHQVHDLVEGESALILEDIAGAQVVQDLLVSADLHKVVKVKFRDIISSDLPLRNYIQSVEIASSCDFLID